MKRNTVVLLVVILFMSGLLFWGRRISRMRLLGVASLRPVPIDKMNGSPAPEFELASLDGKQVKLSDFRGQAVLLNFWATWCEPCKIEMPWFVDLQKHYGSQGLAVIGVAMDDSGKETIAKFAKDLGVNYPVLLGKETVGEAYGGVQFLPTTFYIDRGGRIVDHVFGLTGKAEIEDNIRKALKTGLPQATATVSTTNKASTAKQ